MIFIKKKWITILVLFFFLAIFPVKAQTPTPTITSDTSSDTLLKDIQNRINELEKKVADLQSQEKTLSSQIAVMDSQIRLTELRISAVKQEIEDITKDIETTSKKIASLEESLDKLTKVLINRVIATYQVGSIQPLAILLSSSTVSDFFTRANYLRIAQAHDKKLIFETQQAKNDYSNQKQIFEGKKEKVEALKKQLETYTARLDQEKQNKQALLGVTQNDERKYQDLLARARAERAAIEGVIATIKLVNGTPIKEGDLIAVVGNTGYPYCSTGPHLHFEVRKDGAVEDPNNYLRSGTPFIYSYEPNQYDYYGIINPHGSWNWPLNDPVKINQGYGSHGYARSFYPGGVHTGIDMESDSSPLIKAPKDGTLYKGTTSCSGVPMNYAAIDHGNGIISWYWHVR